MVELEEAIAFYEDERPGLGLELLDEVEAAVSFAVDNPQAGEARGPKLGRLNARRFLVRRFPYVLYVATTRRGREVVAVAHARRRPEYWRDRIG
ncbi:MAG: type II toxin-antitoxin system RelE/ParE family toxin [Sandaracinaceae bacterium]|nr:type II toxin-antitoxin system RelE/ParE family toxin [Sandaracinaceae bacterium]MBK7151301.1 type II toxin-antitoxin system RelE/ParE family toxin [Sandaracinaceae bacterium]MBK8407630.1 type II toxin-antitoxin system RelE/ParE family toxin [Sandaracinaceae bacterium]